MKKAIVCIIIIILGSTLYCQLTYDWNWAQSAGGTSGDNGKAIATDSSGNVYVTGMYQQTANFGSITLTDDGSFPYEPNIFIAKMDPSGNWLWAKKVICNNYRSVWVEAINVDTNGNCIIVGQHNGASFGTQIVSNGGMDGFIAKLDTNGNWLWAKTLGGSGSDAAYGVGSDTDGNIYVTGRYSDTVIVDTTLLISAGSYDVFVVKMDSNGNWVWAKRAGGSEWDYGYGISTDNSGNSFVTGSFGSSSSFGSVNLSSNGYNDIFVAKIDTYGNWLWANKAGSNNSDEGLAVVCDNAGNVFVTGKIGGISTFGTTTIGTYGSPYQFVAKLDIDGNWLWAQQIGQGSYSIAVGNNGLIYVLGSSIIDTSGNLIYTWQIGSTSANNCFGIATDNMNNVYATGRFSGNVSIGSHNLISNGNDDVFVAKLSQKSPITAFSSNNNSGLEPLQVQFSDLSLIGWGSISSWHWDFGDGATSNEQNPLHLYENDGIYSVSLVVTNSYSLSDTLSISDYINVLPRNPEIAFTPSSAIDFGVTNLGSVLLRDLWIKNTGTATLNVDSLALAQSFSRFEVVGFAAPCQISENDSLAVQIKFTPVNAGAITDSLIVYNNSINNPRAVIRLRGTGQYVPPLPPDNVAVQMNGLDAVISWDAVTETELHTPIEPDYYLVFYNGSEDPEGRFYYHGATPNLSYTQYLVGLHAEHMFYRIRAYKYYGRGGVDFTSLGLVPGMTEAEVMDKLQRW
jgi:PKD repeat protein